MKLRVRWVVLIAVIIQLTGSISVQAFMARYTGWNNKGQGGLGGTETRYVFTPLTWSDLFKNNIKSVAMGREHMLILLDSGFVFACGDNTYGQLGIGAGHDHKYTPYWLSEWESGITGRVLQVACGDYHSMVLTEYQLYVFGRNDDGQLGLNDQINRFLPVPTLVAGSSAVKSIAAGGDFSAWIHCLGYVYVAGDNAYGQLGLYDKDDRDEWTETGTDAWVHGEITDVFCGRYHMFMWRAPFLYAAGRNENGELGIGNTLDKMVWTDMSSAPVVTNLLIEDIACGDYHTVLLTADGKAYATGDNLDGQLGVGDKTDRTQFTQMILSGDQAMAIGAGGSHSMVLLNDGRMVACGRNDYGQLGLKAPDDSDVPTPQIVPGVFMAQCMVGSRYNSAIVAPPARAVPYDYDGDGRSDPGVFWKQTGQLFAQLEQGDGFKFSYVSGSSTALFVPGDYDGDGIVDMASFDPVDGHWNIYRSTGVQGSMPLQLYFGWGAVTPTALDYDGDGVYEPAVYWQDGPPDQDNWYIQKLDGEIWSFNFGWPDAFAVGGVRY